MRPRSQIRGAVVLVATTLGAALAPASMLRAQDHVNITIVAPTLGSFPVLAAGSFDITNSDKLVQHTAAGASGQQHVVALSVTEPVKVEMTMPWGGEIPQLLQSMTSGAVPSAIDHITCDFVHAGSSQPYYTVVIDHPLVSHIDLAYDSASAAATEQLKLEAPQVEFLDGSAGTTGASTTQSTTATGTAARALMRPIALPHLRLLSTPVKIRQLGTSMAGVVAGPPVDGFASFAATGSSTAHFAPEGSFPAWATGAMANVESLSVSFARDIVVYKQTLADGSQQAFPRYGNAVPTTATFTKPVGSLSNDLQAAISGHQKVTTTFELADVPGRLAYSFQFVNGYISSDHTSLSNGHASEQVTVTNGYHVQVTNLRNNVTAQTQ